MNNFKKNLPTSENRRLGGGILDNNKKKEPRRLKKIIVSLISIVTLIMVVSFSYAYIKYETKEKNENIIGTECIKIEMEEVTEALNLYHAYPMKEETGSNTDAYQFKIRNACGVGVDYQVELEVENVEENKLPSQDIAVKLDSNNKLTLTQQMDGKDQETYKIGTGTLKPYEEKSHEVRIWIDENAGNESQNKIFKSKVVIEAVQNEIAIYSEPLLQGADPVLGKGMVAVQINEENGDVTKADPTAKWYEYGKKKWANAVILANGKEDTYETGATINEEDIESYFVWIPKYQYQIFDMGTDYTGLTTIKEGKEKAIEIRFGLENTTDSETECTTPTESGGTGTCEVGKWMTHPAFLAFPESEGIWVGKFETGYNQNEDNSLKDTNSWKKTGAEKDTNEPTKVIIKPNVYSWRNITVGNAFNTSKQYKTELQSHMLKNTEWGVVAYLTQSIYGRCTNTDGETTCEEIRINNSQNYVTGVSAKIAPTTGYDAYKDYTTTTPRTANEKSNVYPSSTEASTTKNNTGIFDMSGGTWEYVMGVMTSISPNSSDKSGLTLSKIEEKYYDKYNNINSLEYNKRILGDATGEMGPFQSRKYNTQNRQISSWHNDEAWFVSSSESWFNRGGAHYSGTGSGVFDFRRNEGAKDTGRSFRIALAPTNSAS